MGIDRPLTVALNAMRVVYANVVHRADRSHGNENAEHLNRDLSRQIL